MLILVIGWAFFGWFKNDTWTGHFYYDPNNLENSWQQSGLKDINACRDWVSSQVYRDYDGEYDYECGKNCTVKDGFTVAVCETTER